MTNLFFRTNVAPYRIDTYNILHDSMNFELFFLYDKDSSQPFDMNAMYERCHFTPHILRTVSLFKKKYKICTEIGKLIRQYQPQVIIVPEFKIITLQVLLFRLLHQKNFKVISMCDDSYDMVANDNDFSWLHKMARKIIVPHLTDILLVDKKVVRWYQEHYNKGIWLPILRDEKLEVEAYRQAETISDTFVEKYKLEGKSVLLYVGRLVKLKNLSLVLKSINKCKEDFTFVIVGSGDEESNLKDLAIECGHEVIFAGRYEGNDVKAWYNIADVFVLASYLEAYGAVTNEALLAGCQCVVSKNCGSSCLIDDNNGVVVDPYDEESISLAIDELMTKCKNRKLKKYPKINLMQISFDDVMNEIRTKIL